MKTGMSLRNKGFTLVEILVAVAVLAVAGTMIFSGFIYSLRTHTKTTQLQMAEDVAQEVAEEFKSQSIKELITTYSGTETTNAYNEVHTVTFTGVGWRYEARDNSTGTNDAVKYTVDVKLTSKNMADNPETGMKSLTQTGLNKEAIGGTITAADYTGNMTTYNQHKYDETNGYYVLDGDVGTNTFIIPEVVNIYDDKRVVISEELNQFDGKVTDDMVGYIENALTTANSTIPLPVNQYNVMDAIGKFEGIYYPLTNMTSDDQIKKTTTIELISKVQAGKVEYYYVVNVSYTLKFDYMLINPDSTIQLGNLSSFMDAQKVAGTNVLTTVSGATSSYTIEKIGTKEYKITYAKTLSASAGDPAALDGKKASFYGKLDLKEPVNLVPEPEAEDDEVPYFYVLYKPFDLYSSGTYSTDEIIIEYTHGAGNKNCARMFLVVQDMNHAEDTNKVVKVNNCYIKDVNAETLKKYFKFYTNSPEIIAKNEVTNSSINADNYLTNSYNQNHINLYDMEITVYNHKGDVVARVNTIKED